MDDYNYSFTVVEPLQKLTEFPFYEWSWGKKYLTLTDTLRYWAVCILIL